MESTNAGSSARVVTADMTARDIPLATVYRGWDGFQRSLVRIISPLSPEQLALPVVPHHWSLGTAIQHIVTNRSWWFHTWMNAGTSDILAYTNWDGEGQPVRSPAELVTGLEATGSVIQEALARWTIADLGDIIEPPASLTETERAIFGPLTRHEIIWHVHAHDYHHGGELALGMGGYKLPTLSGWGS